MNFALSLIITITTLPKILGTFNAVFTYTGISLRSLVTRVGYHLPSSSKYSMQDLPPTPPSPNERVCMSECTICKSLGWAFLRWGLLLSVGVSKCVINPHKRHSIVFITGLSNFPWNRWLLYIFYIAFVLFISFPQSVGKILSFQLLKEKKKKQCYGVGCI